MNTSITTVVAAIVVELSVIAVGGSSNTSANADYVAAIERYDVESWASYDSVDRHEVTSGTDRGAQLYVYRQEEGKVKRVVFDYGLSQTNTLYCLLYKDGKLVKTAQSRRRYRSGKDGEIAFCQPYPQAEINRIYFRGSEVVCLSPEDKTCEAIRSDPAKQEMILRGASDLLRRLSTSKPESEVPDVDFLKYLSAER
jgi:hypothetical protein